VRKFIVLLLAISCSPQYKFFKSFEKNNVKIDILTDSGRIKVGENKLKVVVEPKTVKIKEVFLYMPPNLNEDEKRIPLKVGNQTDGTYEGYLRVDEKGVWDLVIILNDGSAISERIPIGIEKSF
jgi:hypothetical protein